MSNKTTTIQNLNISNISLEGRGVIPAPLIPSKNEKWGNVVDKRTTPTGKAGKGTIPTPKPADKG